MLEVQAFAEALAVLVELGAVELRVSEKWAVQVSEELVVLAVLALVHLG